MTPREAAQRFVELVLRSTFDDVLDPTDRVGLHNDAPVRARKSAYTEVETAVRRRFGVTHNLDALEEAARLAAAEANTTIEVLERLAAAVGLDPMDALEELREPLSEGVRMLLLDEVQQMLDRLRNMTRLLQALDPALQPMPPRPGAAPPSTPREPRTKPRPSRSKER